MIEIVEKNGNLGFHIRISPRAKRSELQGEHDGALKLRIAAPPIEGRANAECKRFVGELLGVPASGVDISRGASSKTKLVLVRGLTREELQRRLAALSARPVREAGKS